MSLTQASLGSQEVESAFLRSHSELRRRARAGQKGCKPGRKTQAWHHPFLYCVKFRRVT